MFFNLTKNIIQFQIMIYIYQSKNTKEKLFYKRLLGKNHFLEVKQRG